MVRVTAFATKEVVLRASVRFFDMSTESTTARGIARVHLDVLHAVQPRLVVDKLTELIETPIAALCPVLVPDPGPQVDARQIFEGNALLRAFSLSDKLFTDAVINVSLESVLFVLQFTQSSVGRLGIDLLQFLSTS